MSGTAAIPGPPPRLACQDLRVAYGSHTAVDGVDLEVAEREIVAVLGPSGCGKSTLLRAIAGLQPPRTGRVLIDGIDVTHVRPDRRDVGLMFQEHALFPHRDVAANVGFGLRMQRLAPAQIDERVDEVLRMVRLEGMADRRVTALSGGERQRVALARTLAPRPRLLMFDEPLASLDRALRQDLLDELAGLLRTIGATALYVTHDQDEALEIADRVAVMRDGRLVQIDQAESLWRNPRSESTARFLGLDQVVDAVVENGIARTPLTDVPLDATVHGTPAPGAWRLVLLPDALRVASDRGEDPTTRGHDLPRFSCTVVERRPSAHHLALIVDGPHEVRLRIPVWYRIDAPIGGRVEVLLDPASTRLVPAGEQSPGRPVDDGRPPNAGAAPQ